MIFESVECSNNQNHELFIRECDYLFGRNFIYDSILPSHIYRLIPEKDSRISNKRTRKTDNRTLYASFILFCALNSLVCSANEHVTIVSIVDCERKPLDFRCLTAKFPYFHFSIFSCTRTLNMTRIGGDKRHLFAM